ncbi:MAG: HAD family phosphatase [Rikenellaceae bacterium]
MANFSSKINTIIFDIGGVLVDLDYPACMDAFKAIGFHGADKLISCYHPSGIVGELERGEISKEQLCDKMREMAGVDMTNEQITEAYGALVVGIPVEKLRLMAKLKSAGYRILALSNINEMVLPRVLSFFEADGKCAADYFDEMYLSFQMGSMKPERKIYELLISDSGIEPNEAFFIDDSEKNIEVGRDFGLNVYLAEAKEDLNPIFEEFFQ